MSSLSGVSVLRVLILFVPKALPFKQHCVIYFCFHTWSWPKVSWSWPRPEGSGGRFHGLGLDWRAMVTGFT